MRTPGDICKERKWTASALFGVALIQGMLGFVGWSMNGRSFGGLDWVFSFSGVFYFGLALAVRWIRFPAALIGAGLYAGFLALQLLHGVAAFKSGLIFKVPIVALLFVAVLCGCRWERQAA